MEARGPGPNLNTVYFRSHHSRPPHMVAAMQGLVAAGYPTASPTNMHTAFTLNESMFPPFTNMGYAPPLTNGGGPNGLVVYPRESQLSAAVPDFSPSGLSGAPFSLEPYQNYSDEQVSQIVVRIRSRPETAEGGPAGPGSEKAAGAGMLNGTRYDETGCVETPPSNISF